MIPLRVTLKNFLSYGPIEQSVNFEPYSLICLSGRNGHGKSSILDAITWAVWGCARKMLGVSKGDEGLVHLGQKEMVIHLDFLANGQKYRIRREYFKSIGKPITRLDIEIFDADINQYVTLTDKSVRATQEKIESLVGVDFATFVSTSFLRQGQSNEFSKKTPRERKEIIASILNLSAFDHKASNALEKSKEIAQKILILRMNGEQAQQVAAQKADVESAIVVGSEKIDEVNKHLAGVETELESTGVMVQQSLVLKQENQRLLLLCEATANREREFTQKFTHAVLAWRTLHKKIIKMPVLDDVLHQRDVLTVTLNTLRSKEIQARDFHEKYTHETTKLSRLEVDLKHAFELKKIDVLRKKNELLMHQKYQQATVLDFSKRQEEFLKQSKDIKLQQGAIIGQLAEREVIEHAYDFGKKLFEKRRSFYHACVSKKNAAIAVLSEIAERKDAVGSVESPSCPLCEQLLTMKRKQFLAAQLAKQEQFEQHKFDRVSLVLKMLEEVLKAQRTELEKTAQMCSAFHSLEQDLIRLNGLNEECERERLKLSHVLDEAREQQDVLHRQLSVVEQEIVSLEADHGVLLSSHPGILEVKQQIAALEKDLVAVGYDAEEHKRAISAFTALDGVLRDIQQRENLFQEGLRLRHGVSALLAQVRQARAEFASFVELKKDVETKLVFYQNFLQKLNTLEAEKRELMSSRDSCSRELGSLMERKKRCEEAQKVCLDLEGQLDGLLQEKREYDYLAEAFGKNGIQALLIEGILPEIEQEANSLLAQLTDNQMQIFIESLRDLKSGGVRETLDIQISDGVGVRPYEMFSGGEAFRIDFALRIAVSRLLARRAGTHLQTLFIDEGFGSQDEDGLSRLTQALFAVQRDFEKIIIVSHLERLKENFPVHVIVEKRGGLSTVHVEERG